MKVLYVAGRYDPLDHLAGSGLDHDLYHSIKDRVNRVDIVGPFSYPPNLVERLYFRFHRFFGDKRPLKYAPSYLRRSARVVEETAARLAPDVLLARSSAPLVHSQFTAPLVYVMDSSLVGSQQQWPIFSEGAYRRMLRWEQAVLSKAARVLTFSEWNRGLLQKHYGVPADRVTAIAIPASIPADQIPPEVHPEERDLSRLRLLLVGVEFERKGVDIAMAAVDWLNENGYPAELRVVGQAGQDSRHTRFMGKFKKTVPAELQGYMAQYRWAHILLHPARFEAAGIVPGEAAAFGVPTITNASGGLATTVADGVSGVVLPAGSPPEAYARAAAALAQDRQGYVALCQSTRRRYEQALNWNAAGEVLYGLLEKALQG